MSEPINPYASPEVESMAPGAAWTRDISSSLQMTRLGLSMVYFGIVIVLLSIIVMTSSGFLAFRPGPMMLTLISIVGFGLLVGLGLSVLGPLFCLAVPAESGAKPFIIASVALQFANLVVAITQALAPSLLPIMAVRLVNLLGLIGGVMFVLFMRKLALYIGRGDLAYRVRNLLISGCVVFVFAVTMIAMNLAGVGPTRMGLIAGLLGIAVGLGGLALFLMYANLVDALRKAAGARCHSGNG